MLHPVDALAVAKHLVMDVKRGAQRCAGVACRRLYEDSREAGASFERRVGQAVQRHTARQTKAVFGGRFAVARGDVAECLFKAGLQAGGKITMCGGQRVGSSARLDPGTLKKFLR